MGRHGDCRSPRLAIRHPDMSVGSARNRGDSVLVALA